MRKTIVFGDKEGEHYFAMDEMKIALGPFQLGMCVAFIILFFETLLRCTKNEETTVETNQSRVNQRRRNAISLDNRNANFNQIVLAYPYIITE